MLALPPDSCLGRKVKEGEKLEAAFGLGFFGEGDGQFKVDTCRREDDLLAMRGMYRLA